MVLSDFGTRALQEARALMPTGAAWTTAPGSVLSRLLEALSSGSARAEERGCDLLDEADPRAVDELLTEWETALGLPDECLPVPADLEERRALVLSRSVGVANASPAYFRALANALGYSVAIEEGTALPFRVGKGRAGQNLGSEFGRFNWTMVVYRAQAQRFTIGRSRVGDELLSYTDELLECVIRRAAPAHTRVTFRYQTGQLPGDVNPGQVGGGGEVEECWWPVGAGASSLRILTDDGRLWVYDETGAALEIPLQDEAFNVLDEAGQPLSISLECGEVAAADCYLPIDAGGVDLRWPEVDDALLVQAGSETLRLPVANDRVTVLVEDGQALDLPLICGEVAEEACALEVDLGGGVTARLELVDDVLTVFDETGAPLSWPAVGEALLAQDELGAQLTLPLACGEPVVEDCALEVALGGGVTARLALQDDVLPVLDENGALLSWPAVGEALLAQDELGAQLTLPLACGEAEEACSIEIDLGGGATTRLVLDDDALNVLDQDGAALRWLASGSALPVQDESGATLSLPISCE